MSSTIFPAIDEHPAPAGHLSRHPPRAVVSPPRLRA